jgi:NADH:ubiquinone oxidoreductase subunit E
MTEEKKKIRVCRGCSCKNLGSFGVMEELEKYYDLSAGDSNDKIDLDFSDCMDNCSYAPSVRVNNEVLSLCERENIAEKVEKSKGFKKQKNKIDYKQDNFLGDL